MLELSVVLATYNRAETVRRTLRHLADQNIDPATYEIIVVDDASPDDTETVVAEVMPQMPCAIRYMRNEENRGPGHTQNRGIREAKAPLLMLMADDIWLSPEALGAHIAHHKRHPEPEVAALGKVQQSPELNQSVFLRNWDPWRMSQFDGDKELPYYMFWACNMSLKRDYMLENGMFRDEMGRGGAAAHEDVELGYRMSKAGLRVMFCEQAAGQHYHYCTLDQAIGRYYQRGLNWEEFCQIMPDPEFTVHSHVLNRRTFSTYMSVLRRPDNSLKGIERRPAWHLFRQSLRTLVFNRITVAAIWNPLFRAAETSKALAGLVNSRLYGAFLFYHFNRGVLDAPTMYGR